MSHSFSLHGLHDMWHRPWPWSRVYGFHPLFHSMVSCADLPSGSGHRKHASATGAFLSFPYPKEGRLGDDRYPQEARAVTACRKTCLCGWLCICTHECVLCRIAYLRGSTFQNAGAQGRSSCARIPHLSCSPPQTLLPLASSGERAPAARPQLEPTCLGCAPPTPGMGCMQRLETGFHGQEELRTRGGCGFFRLLQER